MIEPIVKPNFFILGAAKSGTTFLYNTLTNHPEIFFPTEKEPSFLSYHFDKHINSTAKYFELFDDVKDEKMIGEASPNYLPDPSSPRILKGLFPDAKFVVTLRNPADRAYSMYVNMRRYGHESYRTFEKALRAENKRLTSQQFKEKHQYFYHFLYFNSGLFGEQIQRYFELFDEKQFYIVTIDQIKSNFEETIKSILMFLEVDTNYILPQGDQHQGYDVRFLPLQILKRKLPRQYRKYLDPLASLNQTKTKPIDPETRAELMEKYKDDLGLLYQLTGIDLTE
jgi:hypothetical protein